LLPGCAPAGSDGRFALHAEPGNADAWTQALWQYQDLSEIQGSSPAAYRSPLYVSTYGDRFGLMKPGPSIPSGATILWELGVPMTAASCPADIDNTGTVGGRDLATLLAGWSGDASCMDCVADLNGDHKVNADDLTVMPDKPAKVGTGTVYITSKRVTFADPMRSSRAGNRPLVTCDDA